MAVLGLNAIAMMFFIPAYPFWALVILAADVIALWGLCAYDRLRTRSLDSPCKGLRSGASM